MHESNDPIEECQYCKTKKKRSELNLLSVWNCFGLIYFCNVNCASAFSIKISDEHRYKK